MDFHVKAPVQVKRLRKDAIPLRYAHDGDSGMDVFVVALKRVVQKADGKFGKCLFVRRRAKNRKNLQFTAV